MTIGVDLRVLQIGHQFRGVGESAKRTLNSLFELAATDEDAPEFIFYAYEDDDPLRLLDVPKTLKYQSVSMGKFPKNNPSRTKQEKIARILGVLFGNPIKQAKGCDVFLQFDYSLGVPTDVKTVLIKHDIIPYIFWDKYFTSAWVPFKHRAARTTLRTLRHNYEYMHILKRSLKNAKSIMCVSESTKNDLAKHFKIPAKKMKVFYWGVSEKATKTDASDKPAKYPTKPFLLFVGAIDPMRRRAVDDLVVAFNNLKARGHDLQLVLVGENFQSPKQVPVESVRNAIMQSSYKKDIMLMGYVSDPTKQKLYKEAVAFVFPTVYEGFGIPVLESMLLECPVVVYNNSSIPEVGGKHALYADGWEGIEQNVEKLLQMPAKDRQTLLARAKRHARSFTWDKTGREVYAELIRVGRSGQGH